MADINDLVIDPIIIPETIQEEAEEAEGVVEASGIAGPSRNAGSSEISEVSESTGASGSAGASGIANVIGAVKNTGNTDEQGAWGFEPLDPGRLAQEQKDDDNQMIQIIDFLESVRFDPSKFKKQF